MHGRLKVKTTEEQQRARQEERAKRIKVYTAATSTAFHKRQAGELDEELLGITGQVLQANPDFYTFWNIRKETFLHLHDVVAPDELQKSYQAELDFLESCLKVNPKSYGTWHHRCFVMDHMPAPDWSREMQLCNLFLQYDERNFHCWDYRRFVVQRQQVAVAEELAFTTTKISSNFSNFSSWHYRSKLLPLLHPHPTQPSRLAPHVLHSEFEMVQNGLFTDPEDQSNWFYHKWLVGRGERKQQINHVYVSCSRNLILVSLTNPVKMDGEQCCCQVKWNQSVLQVKWTNQKESCTFSTLWIGAVAGVLEVGERGAAVEVEVAEWGQVWRRTLDVPPGADEAQVQWSSADLRAFFRQELSGLDEETLHRELDVVSQLLEVETSNKWAMLTVVLLMQALDPNGYRDQVVDFLQRLRQLDPFRDSYYRDLCSRFTVERAVEGLAGGASVQLSGCGLTCMSRTELLTGLGDLDLSDNELTTAPPCAFLQRLTSLRLAGNRLTNCRGLERLPCLTTLDLRHNNLSTADSLSPLQTCPQLSVLELGGNPVCECPCIRDQLAELLPGVTVVMQDALQA